MPRSGLAGGQRAGCIAGAGKDVYDTPVAQTRLCAGLRSATDSLACLRGVANQAYAGRPHRELALFSQCTRMPADARLGCASWFGQTFNVLENGRFLKHGCPKLARTAVRAACEAGARRWKGPLRTFS